MKIISITGAKSHVGKSTLAAKVISWLKQPAAIKCTLPRKGEKFETFVTDSSKIIDQAGTDTWAFRKAGANPVVWVHTNPEAFSVSFNEALSLVNQATWLVIEGNRSLQAVEPDLIVFVTTIQGEMKPSAILPLEKAHVIIINIHSEDERDRNAIEARQKVLRDYNRQAPIMMMNLMHDGEKPWLALKEIMNNILEEA